MEILDNAFEIIKNVFPTFYTIENSEDCHKIVICCKNKELQGKKLISDYFQKNNSLFNETSDMGLIGKDYERIVPKLIFRREKRLLEKN